MKKKTT